MNMAVLIILVIIVIMAVILVIKALRPQSGGDSMVLLQQQMDNLRQQLAESLKNNTEAVNSQLLGIIGQVNKQLGSINEQMMNSQKNVGERLDNAARVVGEVQKELGSLSKAAQQIFDVGKDISSLQEILRAPKLRGTLGELFLQDLLGQILPNANYAVQYKFKSGEAVDAVIKLGQGLVPVDSKFPLENFKRVIETRGEADQKTAKRKFITDVKKHIDSIASKYILPDEGTFDFALMYIPAENVYYEMIIKDETLGEEESISAYALGKRVIPVSPNSFYAYLQAIVLGLKGMKIEKSAMDILQYIARLKGEFTKFQDDFDVLGKHITNIKGKYDDSSRRLEKLGEKILNTGEGKQLPEPQKKDEQLELR